MDKKLNIRTAVILCGGKGSRLGAIGKKIPKSLVKVKNKRPLILDINSIRREHGALKVAEEVDALDVVVAGSLAHPAGDVASLVGDVPHGARAPVCNRRRIERREKKVSIEKKDFSSSFIPKS